GAREHDRDAQRDGEALGGPLGSGRAPSRSATGLRGRREGGHELLVRGGHLACSAVEALRHVHELGNAPKRLGYLVEKEVTGENAVSEVHVGGRGQHLTNFIGIEAHGVTAPCPSSAASRRSARCWMTRTVPA